MELREKQGFKKSEIGLIPTEWRIDKFKNVTNAITCGVACHCYFIFNFSLSI